MRANQKERESFLLRMQAEGVPPEVARKVLRHAATVQRLAVAECNGDRPYNPDPHRAPAVACFTCNTMVDRGNARSNVCQACRAEALIKTLLAPFNVAVVTQGDPRGACVKLRIPSGRGDSWGDPGLLCVPTPGY